MDIMMSMRDRKIQTEQKTRKFLTSAGFPSVWCLSGVPEGLLIAGDHQTNIQTRGKSNSPPSRSRPRQRGRRCPLLFLVCSSELACCVLVPHCNRPYTFGSRLGLGGEKLAPKATSLPSCASETTKYSP